MTSRPKVIAMVQLPPPMHGAAKMNRIAINSLAKDFDLHVIEMCFARTLSEVNRFSLRKMWVAVWLWLRLIWALPRAKALYICFAPNGFAYYRDCIYVLLAKLLCVPAILHLHGRGLPEIRRSKWSELLQKTVFKGQAVILLGESLRAEIEGLDCKSAIIANCLNDDAFVVPATKQWVPHNPIRLLWLSNLFRAKGIETLLAACEILHAQDVACHLTIAGAKGDISKAELATLLEKYQMHTAASYLGPVSDPERQGAFENSDLFIFPSHYPNEAQPLVVLEAMVANVPVITSNIATLPEFVRDGETGRLCPPQDPEELANAISAAIGSPEKTTVMRDAAYQMCRQEFRQDRFAEKLRQRVHSIIENH
ncbi:MAG: glycosyltransferase family 4 protein [Thalassospira sp.]|uniref:glycosyltransferase family 4 protein n=1 Tax=Thalassospira sp. TaxID=1912094 RepID=UPI001AFF7190|nr:glycosyltransferase family 4 protein [Thalassospira sp.]MBO6579477.1 glycosyltransferase family 4 protein [Thalassospira sp.]MBO6802507.1 glycosyltransferase family 4 protein [Thalassospira sp.]MBO6819816.1 glycosyltransferase family 4 protein [Thalassospira sp.]MBO6886487.1 glycosyltransferase family 4 protein [Thalassospira sp.]